RAAHRDGAHRDAHRGPRLARRRHRDGVRGRVPRRRHRVRRSERGSLAGRALGRERPPLQAARRDRDPAAHYVPREDPQSEPEDGMSEAALTPAEEALSHGAEGPIEEIGETHLLPPGTTFHSVTDTVCKPIEDKTPMGWFIGFGIALTGLGIFGAAVTWLLYEGVGV